MVYMTPSELGWRPFKTQWINKFIKQKGKKRDPKDQEQVKKSEPVQLLGAPQI